MSPQALIGERVEFVWKNEARFKHLSAADAPMEAALASFGMVVGGLLLRATKPAGDIGGIEAFALREAILAGRPFVDLQALIATCWGVGIPVVHIRIFPLDTKSMHAMVVRSGERCAILLGRDASYPAPVAFTLAHEIGHITLRHLENTAALVDMEESQKSSDDNEESQADRFALALLTGSDDPQIETDKNQFNAPTLANAVLRAGPRHRIEPGALALCLAHQRGQWPVAMSALKFIYDQPLEVWREVNSIADHQLDWLAIGEEAADYVRRILGSGE